MWEHEQVMDTPLPAQVRPLEPNAEAATDEDVVELLEMILGAIGRDALGECLSLVSPNPHAEPQPQVACPRRQVRSVSWMHMIANCASLTSCG